MARNHDYYLHGMPEEMNRLFADTFFFFAFLNADDSAHREASTFSMLLTINSSRPNGF